MKVAIFGAGYVGLVTGACLAHIGHHVVCVDVDPAKVAEINAGRSPIYEPGLDEILTAVRAEGRFSATTDAEAAIADSELSMIAVGTPPKGGRIDLGYVAEVSTTIGKSLAKRSDRHTVVVKSTVVPGTTNGLVREALEKASGKRAGVDFGLCQNPEFLREGCAVDDFMNPDRIVIGQFDDRSGDALAKLYAPFDCPHVRVALVNSELIKYASNTLLATLISFSNELYGLCEALPGADGEVVMDGLHLDKRLAPIEGGKRIVPQILGYLRGGIGYGGSCLPKDLTALRAHAEAIDVPMPLLGAVMSVNARRPTLVIDAVARALGGLKGKRVAVMGLAFKPDTDDLRESPAIPLVDALLDAGAEVRAFDTHAVASARARWGDSITIAPSPEALFSDIDAALLATSWPLFRTWDYRPLVGSMRTKVIVDGRNALRQVAWPEGTRYIAVGRGPMG